MSTYPVYNDYEIIALIQEGHEEAFSLLVDKYSRFIAKKIHKFNLAYDFDDIHQEGICILHRSVVTFDPSFNKTFTRYFELNLERHLISTIKMIKGRTHLDYIHRAEIIANTHSVKECSVYYYAHMAELKNVLTELEYRVYILREVKNNPIALTAEQLGVNIKTVYNSLHRAKIKIHMHFKE